MPHRIRELSAESGARARLTLRPDRGGAILRLERPDRDDDPIDLDIYGAEVLAGFLLSARLSLPYGMPDETVEGPCASLFMLETGARATVVVEQVDGPGRFVIPREFWERMGAELDLTIPHAKSLARRGVVLH